MRTCAQRRSVSEYKHLVIRKALFEAYTYRGKAADIKQVGRELGVRCVLEERGISISSKERGPRACYFH
jgi:TolB-like protein